MTTSAGSLVRVGTKPGATEYLRSLWVRREFALAIPSAELRAQHRNTVLGGVWHLLNPILQIGVYFLVFGVLLDVSRGVDNFLGFLTIGVFIFHFTSKSINAGAKSITSNEGLIRTISFPRAILPLSVVLSELAAFGYALVAMIGGLVLTGEAIGPTWLLLLPILFLQLLFNLGAAMFVARLSSHFRDVQQVLPFVLRMWLYLSGVIWPASRFTEELPHLAWMLQLNPAYVYIELVRDAMQDNTLGDPRLWLSAVAWAVVSLVVGFLFFRARENEYGHD